MITQAVSVTIGVVNSTVHIAVENHGELIVDQESVEPFH